LPQTDLWLRRARPRLVEVPRDRLETPHDRLQPLGKRRVIAHEEQEQPVADRVERQ
jgi:hypothetical protein